MNNIIFMHKYLEMNTKISNISNIFKFLNITFYHIFFWRKKKHVIFNNDMKVTFCKHSKCVCI